MNGQEINVIINKRKNSEIKVNYGWFKFTGKHRCAQYRCFWWVPLYLTEAQIIRNCFVLQWTPEPPPRKKKSKSKAKKSLLSGFGASSITSDEKSDDVSGKNPGFLRTFYCKKKIPNFPPTNRKWNKKENTCRNSWMHYSDIYM